MICQLREESDKSEKLSREIQVLHKSKMESSKEVRTQGNKSPISLK